MKWISIKEHLPERGKKVLVLFNGNRDSIDIASRPSLSEMTCLNEIYERSFPEETFDNADWHYPSTNVTHWIYIDSLPLVID